MHFPATGLRGSAATLFLLWLCAFGNSVASEVFIGTLRAPTGSREEGGHLYRVDVETGSAKFIGRVLIHGTQPVGITAMAFHPHTNALYGITAGINDAPRAWLLMIDPSSAEARVVARLSKPLSDISFAPDGRLFGWTLSTGQLALVDVGNGSVSTIGDPAMAPVGGAFAIDGEGNAYVAPWAAGGGLDRVDLRAGTVAPGPPISRVELSSLRSMAFSGAGELFATHSARTSTSVSMLLRIDPATGEASAIGDIPEDSEAIAVSAAPSVPHLLRNISYAALAVLLLVAFIRISGRRASRR